MSRNEFLLLVAACVVWALHYSVAKLAVESAPPLFYGAMRMMLLALVLAPLLKIHFGRMRRILAAGLCLGGINFALFFVGMTYASPSAAAIATQLGAPFAALLSVLILGERIGWRRILGISAAFLGVAMISFKPETTALDIGVVIVAASILLEAVGAIFVKQLTGIPPLRLQAWFGVIGAVTLASLSAVFEQGQLRALAEGGPALFGMVAFSALGASLFSFSIYYWLLQRHDVSHVAPATLMTPVMAIGFGVVLIGDAITPIMAAGAATTLAGVAVVMLRSGARRDRVIEADASPQPVPASTEVIERQSHDADQ
ncbi:MAG: DMT family transporter [Parvularculaceae bacterium]